MAIKTPPPMKKAITLFCLTIMPVLCFAQHYENEVYNTFGDLQCYFASNKIIYVIGDTVSLKFSVTNISESAVSVSCPTMNLINYSAYFSGSTTPCWRSSETALPALLEFVLLPGETRADSTKWILGTETEGAYNLEAALNSRTPPPDTINLEIFIYTVSINQENPAPENKPSIFITAAPNPCKENLKIAYYVPHRGIMELAVFDIMGRKVNTIARGWHRPGLYSTTWNSKNTDGINVPSGTYLIKLTNRNISTSKKIHLIR
ncbi:T9SS type A sorting domain-containing protein [bacterium]|nr:T9SS type A sorting domain-containing protein [bacterium]